MKYFITVIILLSFNTLYAVNKVQFFIGDVKHQASGSSVWGKISSNQILRTGDTIITGRKSQVMIDSDGNIIKIQPETKVRITKDMINDRQQSSLALFSGAVNCKINKLGKTNPGYNVNTAATTCAVRGTDFDVYAGTDGKTILQVTDGAVALSGNTKTIDVQKDYESSVSVGGEPEPVKIIKRRDWEKWAEEATSDVAGREKDIIKGCLAKVMKLDEDITRLEKEGAEARIKADEYYKLAKEAKAANDKNKSSEYISIYQKEKLKAYSSNIKASYQTTRIDLVKEVSDNAYNSIKNKNNIQKEYDLITQIREKHYNKYIKPFIKK